MWIGFQKIVDSVFPPNEELRLVQHCTTAQLHKLYKPTVRDGVTILLPFKNPTVRALIHQAKFHYQQRAYVLLAAILSHHLERIQPTECWILPIPLSTRRWRERGYNQVTEIAKRIKPNITNYTLNRTALKRHRHTTAQTALSRAERLRNVHNAFTCTKTGSPTAIIILDDVCTTGSTLAAARAACAHSYPNVPIVCLVLAG